MSLNQGLKKYKKVASTTASSKASKPEKKAAAEEKREDKKEERKVVETAAAKRKAAAAASAAETSPSRRKSAASATKEPELEEALEEKIQAQEKQKEEEALQAELAQELERDAQVTSTLVKDDFTPVNSTRDKLMIEYAPLIKYIAQKIAARLPANIELDDLISSGVIGLMDAIEKYDSSRDNKFKTYAEFRIRGAILDELRAQDWVPRSVREKAKQLERCYAKIEQEKGRQATDDEVCAALGISTEEFHDMLNQVRSVSLLSYDDLSSFSKADKRSLHGYGEASTRSPTPFNEVNVAAVKRMISEAINDLPEKQRLVLSLYYYEDLNLKEIGRVLDVTESRVSQLHTQAILRLKSRLRTHWDEFVTLFG
jgi:RNA polymerase sigma factor for flagellar operon FliA